jgi:hypothetical protein
VSALHIYIATRQARASLERLLDVLGWPEDRTLSLALDRFEAIAEEAAEDVSRQSERTALGEAAPHAKN